MIIIHQRDTRHVVYPVGKQCSSVDQTIVSLNTSFASDLYSIIVQSGNVMALAQQSVVNADLQVTYVLHMTTIRSRRAMIENVVVTPTANRMYASDSSTGKSVERSPQQW